MLWILGGVAALAVAISSFQKRDRRRRSAAFEAGVHAERSRWHAERRKHRKELEAIQAEVLRLHGIAEELRLGIAELTSEAARFGWAADLILKIQALPETPAGIDG